ncbi:uncharacterized protein LTR77_006967 [Saxophila tyrrhenica]|uniref:Uncharacterized protein n=1 Tax=Saxophila tyrrhenica TaxID=1690608 RepID=A0AAV9P691_9PEZI|nr:hypothetical protein LTR77_006967 [Saxophila tyrrhenica]
MGKSPSAIAAFIEDIPSEKLRYFPTRQNTIYNTIYKDTNFRLDMQRMTSHTPPKHNLQVQVNNSVAISALRIAKGQSVAGPALVPNDDSWTPEEIRKELLCMIGLFRSML